MSGGPVQASPLRVLIVDDERKNRQLLEVILGQEGYGVLTATCGEEALVVAVGSLPDVILLDVMMPGMSGYEVVATIKANPATRHIPVVMLSALDDRNSMMHGMSAGAEGFLAKPVNRGELCACIRAQLQRIRND